MHGAGSNAAAVIPVTSNGTVGAWGLATRHSGAVCILGECHCQRSVSTGKLGKRRLQPLPLLNEAPLVTTVQPNKLPQLVEKVAIKDLMGSSNFQNRLAHLRTRLSFLTVSRNDIATWPGYSQLGAGGVSYGPLLGTWGLACIQPFT